MTASVPSSAAAAPRTSDDAARLTGRALALLLAVGVGALAAALAAEHVFGLRPCELCLLQRWPFAIVAALAAFGLAFARSPRLRRALIWAAGALFAAGAAIAFYHVGVQQHWWAAITGCAAAPSAAFTVDQLKAALSGPQATPPCDQVDWSLYGVSLAGFNAIASTSFAAATFWAARRLNRSS